MSRIVEIPYCPRPEQREVHDQLDAHRFGVVVAHRRFGKTTAVINQTIKEAIKCQKPDPRYGYIAPFYSQAKAVAWDFLKRYTAPIPGTKFNESDLMVTLPNSARIKLYGADNPDALRGLYFDGVCLDEVAQMRPEVWGEVIRPALADREGWAIFIGTPHGINVFHELYQRAVKDPKWYAGNYPVTKTNILSEEELDLARSTMSGNQFRQEFLCDWTADVSNIFIPFDLVQKARGLVIHPSVYTKAAKVLGVDPAREGEDQATIIVRQGLACWGLQKHRKLNLMTFSNIVGATIKREEPHAVFIDSVGLGAGVVDRLVQLGYPGIIAVNVGTAPSDAGLWKNLRAEIWDKMRKWLDAGGAIPDDAELVSELLSITFTYDNPRNVLELESKKKLRERGVGSPDCADALALTFSQEVIPREQRYDRARYIQEATTMSDYDVLGGTAI